MIVLDNPEANKMLAKIRGEVGEIKRQTPRTTTDQTFSSLHKRLQKSYKKDPVTGCWLWAGRKDGNGYGTMGANGKTYSAHRVSAAANLGLNLDDSSTFVLHSCDNKKCVNPDHLRLGDAEENSRDYQERRKQRGEERCARIKSALRKGTPRALIEDLIRFDISLEQALDILVKELPEKFGL